MTEMKGRIRDMLDEGPIKDIICIYWLVFLAMFQVQANNVTICPQEELQ